jgi:hypothetical protein
VKLVANVDCTLKLAIEPWLYVVARGLMFSVAAPIVNGAVALNSPLVSLAIIV